MLSIVGTAIGDKNTGPHEQVAAFIGCKLNIEVDRQDVPYLLPYQCLIRLLETATAFHPDVVALDLNRIIFHRDIHV